MRSNVIRIAAILWIIVVAIFFEIPRAGEAVWWSQFTRILLVCITSVPVWPLLNKANQRETSLTASFGATVFVGFLLVSLFCGLLLGFSPGKGATDLFRLMVILIPLELLMAAHWLRVWIGKVYHNTAASTGSLGGVILAFIVLAIVVTSFGRVPPGGYSSNPTIDGFIRIDGCAWLYKHTRGSFPEKLSDIIGTNAKCIVDIDPNNYVLSGDGVSFRVRATRHYNILIAAPPGQDLVSDESGLIWDHAHYHVRLVRPSWSTADYKYYLGCLEQDVANTGEGLQAFVREHHCITVGTDFLKDDALAVYESRFMLTRTERGFTLESRPIEYGRATVRSYIGDETGRIHVTADNRPATLLDPYADAKEFGEPTEIR